MRLATMRMFWFLVIASAITFTSYTFIDSVFAQIQEDSIKEIVVRDVYVDGVHRISGHIFVPSKCYDLSVKAKDLDSNTIAIVLESWKQPYRDCNDSITPTAFQTVAFAPKDISFVGMYNKEWVKIKVVK